MSDAIEFIRSVALAFDFRAAIDIVVVAAIVYWILTLIEGTTAVAMLRGIALVFLVGTAVSNVFGLTVLGWMLRNAIPALLVAIPILFQPELRRALEQIGRARGITRTTGLTANQRTIDIIADAAGRLAERHWGAIMVIERQIPLGEYADSGIRVDGALSVEFLLSIFYPHSPLHDGAVIIRGDRVLAAGCVLPLAETVETGHQFGTRHRAAIGITTKTDALGVVVSEESGQISISNNGRMVRNLDDQKLRRILPMLYKSGVGEAIPQLLRIRVPSRAS
ncbi:MAG TPA: diadenylate cyclase CdaA [Chloroflexota bacterium]|nr:diadenylate cyclase CdaA [Chloroflexota bacterium]